MNPKPRPPVKLQWRGLYQTIAFFVVLFVLIRLFPLIARFVEAAAMGIRQFWSVMLALALTFWAVWFFKKRRMK